MKKIERISGIVAVSLFSISVLFKMMHWPAASVMLAFSELLFVFVYLPVQLIRERREVSNLLQKIYLILRFITIFIVVSGFSFKLMHWPGSGMLLFLSTFLIPLFILLYFYLRVKGKGKIPFQLSDFIITILAYAIYFFVTKTLVSPQVVAGYVMIEEQYEKANAGLESANDLLYMSLDSLIDSGNTELFETIGRLEVLGDDICNLNDSLKRGFISSVVLKQVDEDFSIAAMSDRMLAVGHLGYRYFVEDGNGSSLRTQLLFYLDEISSIQQKYHLPGALIGTGLDLQDKIDEWGEISTWEQQMFHFMPMAAIVTNLSWIKQMTLLTESSVLNGLVSQMDLSEETQMLQELASKESEKAIALRENEILSMRQQQELQNLQLEKSQTELSQRKTVTVFAFVGIALVLVMFTISTRAYFLKQKDNKKLAIQKNDISDKNDALNQQNEEIAAQRDEIEAQRDMVSRQKEQIEKTHNEISASIDYATRLQSSILPNQDLLKDQFSDHFVLFRPRDKVSGDFFWWAKMKDQVIVAAADCTGHGVPGAFMSMLGISLLSEIVNKEFITEPGVILNQLRKEVIRSLNQTGERGEQKDGLDISVVSINTSSGLCQYAGANNPLYLIQNNELIDFKPEMMPISIYHRMDNFTTREIQLHKGDQLYLFSDGYADQFGGEDRKKFKYKAFKQLLMDHSDKPMNQQLKVLNETIKKWQGKLEQIDDMVVIGIKM